MSLAVKENFMMSVFAIGRGLRYGRGRQNQLNDENTACSIERRPVQSAASISAVLPLQRSTFRSKADKS